MPDERDEMRARLDRHAQELFENLIEYTKGLKIPEKEIPPLYGLIVQKLLSSTHRITASLWSMQTANQWLKAALADIPSVIKAFGGPRMRIEIVILDDRPEPPERAVSP